MTFDDFMKIISPILAVFLAYWLGIHTRTKNTQHEQIIRRYLEQCVDLLSVNVDNALNTFNQNFAHALRLLKEFEDAEKAGIPLRTESREIHFALYDPKSFSPIPFYKLKSLIGDDIFWVAVQDLFVFIDTSYHFFSGDLKLAIDTYYSNRERMPSSDKIVEADFEKVRRLMEESYNYYSILKELQNIALILETDTSLTFDKLEKLKRNKEIIETVNSLKAKFENRERSDSQEGKHTDA